MAPALVMNPGSLVEVAGHLIANAVTKHGLKPEEWSITDDALMTLIRRYTREAGVRNLEREISTLIRKAVKELTIEKTASIAMVAVFSRVSSLTALRINVEISRSRLRTPASRV